MEKTPLVRETIGSRLGFIMLAAGCAIGLGNVWRFPYVTGKYGGAIFVLLYLFFLLILGFPIMVMELSLGRASRRGLYGAFRDLPEKKPSPWRIPGGIAFGGNLVLMMMYTTVSGWMLAYFYAYLAGDMAGRNTAALTGAYFDQFLASPGRMVFFMLLSVVLGSLVCAIGLRNGVERITKILMTGMFLLLLLLCSYTLTLPGAAEGMKFYLLPDWNRFSANGYWQPIAGAMAQAFFTLSLGIGSIAIFGSYTDRSQSLTQESIFIILCDTLVALLSGILVFTACFSYQVDAASGPGLVLVSLTNIFNHLTHGRILGAIFFLFLSVAAMTTVIAVFENLIAFMIDEWHFSRRKASLVNLLAVGLLSLPCALGYNLLSGIQPLGKGSTILDFEDWLISDTLLPLGAFAIVIFCCWKRGWGWDKFRAEADSGKGLKFPTCAKYYLFFVLPVLILILYCAGFYERFLK